jgi:hypothetical protein
MSKRGDEADDQPIASLNSAERHRVLCAGLDGILFRRASV